MALLHGTTDLSHESENIGRPGVPEVDDEIGVDGRDRRCTDVRALEAAGFDEPPSLIVIRITEDAPGARITWLGSPTLLAHLIHRQAYRFRGRRPAGAQDRRQHHGPMQLRTIAIQGVKAIAPGRPNDPTRREPFD